MRRGPPLPSSTVLLLLLHWPVNRNNNGSGGEESPAAEALADGRGLPSDGEGMGKGTTTTLTISFFSLRGRRSGGRKRPEQGAAATGSIGKWLTPPHVSLFLPVVEQWQDNLRPGRRCAQRKEQQYVVVLKKKRKWVKGYWVSNKPDQTRPKEDLTQNFK